MAARVTAVLGSVLLALVLCAGMGPAQAQTCYPPPCGAPAATTAGAALVGAKADAVSLPPAADTQSAAPFVAVGLLMVMTTLTTLCVRRRSAMASPPGHSAAALPVKPVKKPQRSLA